MGFRYFIKVLAAILALLALGYFAFQGLFIPSGPGPELVFQWREGDVPVADLDVRVWQGDGKTYATRTNPDGRVSIPEGGPRAVVLVGGDGLVATQLFAIDATGLGTQTLQVDPVGEVKVRVTLDDGTPLSSEKIILRHLGSWGVDAAKPKPSYGDTIDLEDNDWLRNFQEKVGEFGYGLNSHGNPADVFGLLERLSPGQRRTLIYELTDQEGVQPTFSVAYFGSSKRNTDEEGWATWEGLPANHYFQVHVDDDGPYVMDPPLPADASTVFQGTNRNPYLHFSASFRLEPGQPRTLHCQKIEHSGLGGRLPLGDTPADEVHLALWSAAPALVGKAEEGDTFSWSARQNAVQVSEDGSFAWHGQLPGWKMVTASWSPQEGEVYVVHATVHLEAGEFLDLGTMRVGPGRPVTMSIQLMDRGKSPIDLEDPRLPDNLLQAPLLIHGMELGSNENRTGASHTEFYMTLGQSVRVHGLPQVLTRFTQGNEIWKEMHLEAEGHLRITNPQRENLQIDVANIGLEDVFVLPQVIQGFGEEAVTMRLLKPNGGFQKRSHFEAFFLYEDRVLTNFDFGLEDGTLVGNALEFPLKLDRTKPMQVLILPTNNIGPRKTLPPNHMYQGPLTWSEADPYRFDLPLQEGVVFSGRALYEDGTPVHSDDILLVHLLRDGAEPKDSNRGGCPPMMIPILDEQGGIYLPGLPANSVFFGSFMGKELTFETSDVDTTGAIVNVKKTPYPR